MSCCAAPAAGCRLLQSNRGTVCMARCCWVLLLLLLLLLRASG
jgi:hypothetical protein